MSLSPHCDAFRPNARNSTALIDPGRFAIDRINRHLQAIKHRADLQIRTIHGKHVDPATSRMPRPPVDTMRPDPPEMETP
ncbi:MAG: hypothetical protein ABL934_15700 [Lysobacteraceae bacterium]